ncbi:PREDICTED: solute carrier family 40 member 2-like [Nelumbo nucifera]|uniref:Solute carrier family 40 member n=1 Tax=Nelumbo nucifera TaxID=4432 RepID=A0A1U8ANT9_NELNU|nr:PREDICTED: solute carrier family 40 member 2-like [Nelumbo nucifera]
MRQPFLAQSSRQSVSPSLLLCLYVGHFFARWGARMWEFSVGLYMIDIWPDSLLFAAIYGVVESASTALFGPIIGRWVDRLTYVQVLRLWLLTQNLSFIIAGGAVVALLVYSSLKSTSFVAFISLVVLTNISGAVGVLSTLAGTILIEREWVVVISEGQPPEVLTKMNAVIRRIDLVCKLFAPVCTGFIISFISLKASAMTLALWNTISVWLQYWLLMSVYNGIPSLSERGQRRITRLVPNDQLEETSISQDTEVLLSNVESHSGVGEQGRTSNLINRILSIPCIEAWIVYLQQDVVLPGVALALLYFTVLSFGTLMTAALEWMGIPAYVIGIARGGSATIGIAATVLYPIIQSHISTLRTGLWSIWTQWIFLLVCVASVWVQNGQISAWMLMGGVAASRLGLWMFDLSVIQQMQDHVPESDRCVVGGVQNSLQSMLDLLTYIMGIIISNPQDFGKLIILSFSSVTLAAALYTLHAYRVRKHLFHFEKLIVSIHWLLRAS